MLSHADPDPEPARPLRNMLNPPDPGGDAPARAGAPSDQPPSIESLAAACELLALGRTAKRHLREGNRDLAMSRISEHAVVPLRCHHKVPWIQVQLRTCKNGS